MKKKYKILITLLILFYLIEFHGPYKYSNEDTINYIKEHKEPRSRCMCAWYSMQAIRFGGCYNCYIFPAYAYNKILPQLGFIEISTENYIPKAGDISVLPRNSKSCFGHIAIYDGNNWISDFEQVSIFPGKSYREIGKYQIFRIEDGWHWSHLYNLGNVLEYFDSLSKGIKRIKWK